MREIPELGQDECREELTPGGFAIFQKRSGFRFGTDAVALADFACQNGAGDNVLDLCTGSGIIPVLLAEQGFSHISGLEIQPEIADMARRSVRHNGLEDRIEIKTGDLRKGTAYYPPHSFRTVTCNPPYMEAGANLQNETDAKTIARHEICCTLEDVIRTAAELLLFRGSFFLVHQPRRLADIFCLMRSYSLEPKLLQTVHGRAGQAASLVLVKGVYRGGRELRMLPPRILGKEE